MFSTLLTCAFSSGMPFVDDIGAREDRREELLKAQELTYMNGSTSWPRKVMKNDSANLMTKQQAYALMMLGREPVMLMNMLLVDVVLIGVGALVMLMFKK
ncbi:hypothetical protein D1007_14537 [Hordeum vulgare]|nr:hypothetical protein D1007_14537 [Hordeum vulgare]